MQEEGGRDCASVASRVLEVGKLVLKGVCVFFFKWHAPELFAASVAAVDDLECKVIVVAEESSNGVAECSDHGASKGSEIDDVRCSNEACFGKSVRKHEATFGVGVVNHDGLSVLCGKDVTRQHRLVANGVFGEAANGAHLNREFKRCDGLDGCKSCCGTAHVANHLRHGFRRLEAKTTRVKRESFADNNQMVCGSPRFLPSIFSCAFTCVF